MTVSLNQVCYAYAPQGRPVIDDLSAVAQTGRITGVIGPNAAGKSTLLRLMAGLLAPDRGSVLLGDAEAHAMDSKTRAQRLAYVPQRPRVDASFTTAEVVRLGRYAGRRRDDAINQALAECDLEEDRNRIFTTLSVGEQQRVALARALAQIHGRDDAILLLDEPTSALDPRHVQRTAEILRRSAQQGRVIVAALHDLVLARRLCDDLWVLDSGRLVSSGPAAQVFEPALLLRVYGVRFRSAEGVLLPMEGGTDA